MSEGSDVWAFPTLNREEPLFFGPLCHPCVINLIWVNYCLSHTWLRNTSFFISSEMQYVTYVKHNSLNLTSLALVTLKSQSDPQSQDWKRTSSIHKIHTHCHRFRFFLFAVTNQQFFWLPHLPVCSKPGAHIWFTLLPHCQLYEWFFSSSWLSCLRSGPVLGQLKEAAEGGACLSRGPIERNSPLSEQLRIWKWFSIFHFLYWHFIKTLYKKF